MGQKAETWSSGEKAAVALAGFVFLMLMAQIIRYFVSK